MFIGTPAYPKRLTFLHPQHPLSTSITHLKFITGNFITGSRLLCFNGSVDKSLSADDNRLFPSCAHNQGCVCLLPAQESQPNSGAPGAEQQLSPTAPNPAVIP